MPQALALALLGAGLYAGYRWMTRAARELAADMQGGRDNRDQRTPGRIEKNLGALEFDPAAGVYRPARKS